MGHGQHSYLKMDILSVWNFKIWLKTFPNYDKLENFMVPSNTYLETMLYVASQTTWLGDDKWDITLCLPVKLLRPSDAYMRR